MKILAALLVLQLAATVFLYAKLDGIESEIGTSSPPTPSLETPATRYVESGPSESGLNEARLREIIRDELSRHTVAVSVAPESNSTATSDPVEDPVDVAMRRDSVSQQLEYHLSVGRISNADMAILQSDIARLDPATRTEMLRELTRAINSGRLEGQL